MYENKFTEMGSGYEMETYIEIHGLSIKVVEDNLNVGSEESLRR